MELLAAHRSSGGVSTSVFVIVLLIAIAVAIWGLRGYFRHFRQ